jgi:hypothetical protein
VPRSAVRFLVAIALAAAGVALGAWAALPSVASEEVATPVEVTDATLAWSVSNQTNARSHNPAAINFLAAGVADPGRGGVHLPQSKWSAVAGNVTVQKRDAAGAWQTATWDGLGTDASGATIGMSGPFSGHRVLLSQGVGTLDPGADDAAVAWTGTFSVVYYGGNSIFTVTDPVLEVTGGAGRLTGVMGGWVSDRNDPTVWQPATPQRVTLADFPAVDVTDAGIIAEPAYRGVSAVGSVSQDASGADWGSFPATMIAYLQPLGLDQFWYSTGLSTDSTKVASPVTVRAGDRTPPEPEPTVTPTPSPIPTPENPIVEPPKTEPPTPTPQPEPVPTQEAPDPSASPADLQFPILPTASDPARPLAASGTGSTPAAVALMAASASAPPAASAGDDSSRVAWWTGSGLLLGAAVLLLVPVPRRRAP